MIPLAQAHPDCGAKAVSLGRLLREGLAVPAGFVIADAGGATDWETGLPAALRSLGPGPYAVRSSAVGEDGEGASFAGQLLTRLDVPAAQVAEAVREVAASGDEPGVVAYQQRTGRRLGQVIPVIVQVMVPATPHRDAAVSGVLFTQDPVTGADHLVIEAHRGRGDALVHGSITPQRWTVAESESAGTPHGTPHGADSVLTAPQLRLLCETGRRAQTLFGIPLDLEWVFEGAQLWLLQARPITAVGVPPSQATQVGAAVGQVLVTGTPSSAGVAAGCAQVIAGLDDFGRLRPGDVLVCRATSPAWTPLLERAAAVVTETGGILSHAAIVAREFGIPAITGARQATAVLANGQPVLVDGTLGHVTSPIGDDKESG